MKKQIVAVIVGVSMILTCSLPVAAKHNSNINQVSKINLENNATKVLTKAQKISVLKDKVKLGNATVKLNESPSKNAKEKIKLSKKSLKSAEENIRSKSKKYLSAEKNDQNTTGSAITINDSAGNAYAVNTNTVYNDTMTTEGGQRWYAFDNSVAQKLTVICQAPKSTNVDYNLFLFKYNDQTHNLDLVVDSTYPNTANQQLSTIGQPGVYFMAISSVKGFDAVNPFQFAVISSSTYGDNEPDDNPLQAKSYTNAFSEEDTIDNNFDQDWNKISITEPSIISASLSNVSGSNAYRADIIDSQLENILCTVNANSSKKFVLPAGTYYVRISSDNGFDPQQKYKFDLSSVGQSILLGFSPDYNYIVTTDSNKKVYLNGKTVNVDWKREFNFDYPDGGYEYRSQEVYQRPDSELLGAQYGTYTSTYTGDIPHAFSLIIKNPQYFYWHSRYYNGGPDNIDKIDQPMEIAVSLIINADTGTIVDFNEDNFNFYYINKIESHNFSPVK
ncbi:hypothetical protein [Clostridium felsineum]|uniref:Uncharacterized protein n=1 Tax=Clostridium felsineum TaxID=36839 RepID=A0A1S8L0R1_9CLOT|nr:hypothetical protein [Clostridium felsineum]URZ06003.1 hypothetical protein CLROS_013350 [Clostridium felsineum]URZ11040.1 hypothetical protein CROST_017560 [Clostridium felsineum]